jgi:hypothetical protein
MPVCPAAPRDAIPAAEQAGLELLGQAGMVAIRAADLRWPAQAGLGKDSRTALTAAGAAPIRTGDVAVFASRQVWMDSPVSRFDMLSIIAQWIIVRKDSESVS